MPSLTGVQTCALRSEEHTSELQSLTNIVCRLLLEKKTKNLLILNNDAELVKNLQIGANCNNIKYTRKGGMHYSSKDYSNPFFVKKKIFFFNFRETTDSFPFPLPAVFPF